MAYVDYRYPASSIDDGPTEPPRRRISGWWILAALSLCVVAAAIAKLNEAPFDGSKIAAGTFRWPEGCEQRRYRSGDSLPHACFDRFQRISSKWAKAHHMKVRQTKKSSWYSYYRLGDDAVEKFCVVWEDDCRAGNVYQSVFLTDSRIFDPTSSGWQTIPRARR